MTDLARNLCIYKIIVIKFGEISIFQIKAFRTEQYESLLIYMWEQYTVSAIYFTFSLICIFIALLIALNVFKGRQKHLLYFPTHAHNCNVIWLCPCLTLVYELSCCNCSQRRLAVTLLLGKLKKYKWNKTKEKQPEYADHTGDSSYGGDSGFYCWY